ncbi:MAG TPA: adenylate/guanylate cyclase domain-containing protein [Candidatus Bathyarchaeia archaeon]|nr:adenylate/guanylate cyclase domain-containing protein [Candidatus Bathyarchaeia archaeon]
MDLKRPLSESKRRLAAIMFTDMVDYTSTSEKNETLALSLLEEHRQLLRPVFGKHFGREIKTMGDGFLVEFSSALEAVRCALDVQLLMRTRNQTVSAERRIMLRVAVHLGDVEHRDGDVYGDAVNIASRIHSLAEPGGICITQQVFDHVRNSDEFRTEALGETRLKNVRMPLEIYRVLPPETTPVSTGGPPVDHLRIAALPLAIISSDSQDEYFANGLTEEIINTLSSIPALRVIARTSVMRYKDTKKTAAEIGRELNVGTILEGSVRKAGERVRIAVQLIDVTSEEPVWAEKYDRELKDIFMIQTDISERVADALKVRLLRENRSLIEQKAPENIGAYVLYLRGRYHWSKRNREDLEKAITYFGQAIEKDPNYALAFAGMADCYTLMGRHLYLPADDAFAKAREYANKALDLNESLAEAHTSLAAVLINYDWDWKKAEAQFERAIQLNPNYATAHYWFSVLLETLGRASEAVQEAEKAQQLDPLSPVIGMGVVQAYLFSGHYDKAIDECHRYLDMEPNFLVAHDFLVHLYVQKRMYGEAADEAKKLVFSSERKAEAAAHVAFVQAVSGKIDEAKKTLTQSVENTEKGYSNPSIFIAAYAALGDMDNAFVWAEKAFESGRVAFPALMLSPDLKDLRADPRFSTLLKRAGLELPPPNLESIVSG